MNCVYKLSECWHWKEKKNQLHKELREINASFLCAPLDWISFLSYSFTKSDCWVYLYVVLCVLLQPFARRKMLFQAFGSVLFKHFTRNAIESSCLCSAINKRTRCTSSNANATHIQLKQTWLNEGAMCWNLLMCLCI